MTLHQLQSHLRRQPSLRITLPNGHPVPAHFHITEVGEVTKHFIDCGGTVRRERRISLQLWTADDLDHRLKAEKAVKILELAERTLGLGDVEIEVEYQGATTIERYGLAADEAGLRLMTTQTACLALEACAVPAVSAKSLPLAGSCSPGSGCC